uniref:Saxitoxin and tetrodotoxin-binding protein 1-like n=1 Tax=Sinocyclocheilus grahami TaxID=75366 RepID=A0A672RJD4_SINGR
MSSSVVLAALLGLFSLSQASLPDCKELITPRTLEDDNKSIMAKWIFLEGIADHYLFTDILKTVNSSWMEFAPSTLAKTLTLRNDIVSEGKFLPSCPDCLTMNFISQFKNKTIYSLYLFSKSQNP